MGAMRTETLKAPKKRIIALMPTAHTAHALRRAAASNPAEPPSNQPPLTARFRHVIHALPTKLLRAPPDPPCSNAVRHPCDRVGCNYLGAAVQAIFLRTGLRICQWSRVLVLDLFCARQILSVTAYLRPLCVLHPTYKKYNFKAA